MKLLTGKCLEDFIVWLGENNLQSCNVLGNELISTSLMVHYFDSVGVIIDVDRYSGTVWRYFIDDGETYPSEMGF